ncbi:MULTISPECIES: exopolyphosphatase [unclassified Rathayibacter]|uniref:Ppx/GppA phosphatase family protein n=1 Tax=unclassified Rathayibacter TaxID=2609250 RepID=UPI0010428B01|nr:MULTISPECIES: exopolyphosphatase [unclassified Rathayibacter]MCJ1702459.1 exopolyphosphatase [Rathayibacter sp. VKM Ac-2926]TCL85639.1 exopolyphosphatase/guanosine-5'-triphosphate,3'-diphosphate pyrophosphatase [Rathayibacter sp. PhB192]TCM31460.1 exopolyphosphatase/guanosine-5'-triphosphate,3'-diphosphate pyrophosphatase [Rathayibacter sp. PhB179]
MTATRVAAFDCGTNSLRLLIADVEDGRLLDVLRRTELVRLGHGVDRTGRFDPEALERTLAVTREYAELVREAGAERVRFVATSATRDAADREDFLGAVERIIGVRPETISGEEEAALSFRGALSAVDAPRPVLVVDLGGGSTELVVGSTVPEQAHSMDVGSVRLTERHRAGGGAPTAEQRSAIRADVRRALAASPVDLSATRSVVGVAATVLTVTAHVLRLEAYDRDALEATLPIRDVLAACDELAALSPAATAALPYVRAGREDVLGAGAAIWSEVLRAVQEASPAVTSVTTTAHDILDGLALHL